LADVGYREFLQAEFEATRLEIPAPELSKLARYCAEVEHWNKRMNLTALTGRAMVQRLVVEPVWIAKQLDIKGDVVDIGSGNGSPAIPLCICSGLSSIQMVESRLRRVAFLRHLIAILEIRTAHVHRGRFEDVAAALGAPDWVTLQGVALTHGLLKAIQGIHKRETRLVWITTRGVTGPPGLNYSRLRTPLTGSEILVAAMDQS
jgi:16S rRNA (guanine(527)-N(7))-methyltransferase RsmG